MMLDSRSETGSTARHPQSESNLKPVFSLVPDGLAVEGKFKYDN